MYAICSDSDTDDGTSHAIIFVSLSVRCVKYGLIQKCSLHMDVGRRYPRTNKNWWKKKMKRGKTHNQLKLFIHNWRSHAHRTHIHQESDENQWWNHKEVNSSCSLLRQSLKTFFLLSILKCINSHIFTVCKVNNSHTAFSKAQVFSTKISTATKMPIDHCNNCRWSGCHLSIEKNVSIGFLSVAHSLAFTWPPIFERKKNRQCYK